MLNRRLLRIKAMQYLYAFQQCKKSNLQLAIDLIDESFQPDLNSMEVQDKPLLAAQSKLAQDIFATHYESSSRIINTDREVDERVHRSVENAITFYHKQVKKDADRLKTELFGSVERIFDQYLMFIQLLVDLADFVQIDAEERKRRTLTKAVVVFEHELKLKKNQIIQRIRDYEAFQQEIAKRNLKWDKDLIRQWFRLLQKDEKYTEYRHLAKSSLEQDAEIVDYIFRNIILKNEIIEAYFEEQDINWHENRSVLRNMTNKTLKALLDNTATALYTLSPNWEDDKEFFKDLFTYALEDLGKYIPRIAEKAQNWDVSRITVVDKLILELALSEMVHFPSIPVKASINEYLELANLYSTPESNAFVNGLLDIISQELVTEGKIKKSGRGLLDNK